MDKAFSVCQDESQEEKDLSESEQLALEKQNSRMVSQFVANKIEAEAKKHWDLFYKRNENRFFKDRHWTTREFEDLIGGKVGTQRVLFEVGCGVGNLIFPLLEGEQKTRDTFYYACDISPRAIGILKSNPGYDDSIMNAFECDVTSQHLADVIGCDRVDVCTLVFVLSAIHPQKFLRVLENIREVLKPGTGLLLFRDYALYDMTQLRFKPGHKIADNLYMRQDGTRSYFFSLKMLENLATDAGLEVVSNHYVNRRTVNKKENIDVPRRFIQAKLRKPHSSYSANKA